MTRSNSTPKSGEFALTDYDFEGAARVFRSLEKIASRPALMTGARAKPEHLVMLAKRIHAFRATRKQFFDTELFAEPGWDILLSLYIAEREGYRMNMSSACLESGAPDTTAVRWLETFFELGLARKRANPLDARSKFVELTSEALESMDRLLERAWEDYFPFI
jgi:DNA-binding MarR family transcriptional regulator